MEKERRRGEKRGEERRGEKEVRGGVCVCVFCERALPVLSLSLPLSVSHRSVR
jgi:hypothetical protein